MSMRPGDPVAVPPSGTVTFLFTDVEGSTVRWERDPDVMSSALSEHDSMIRSTIEANGGFVFATGGDGFAAAFKDASSALRAAVDGQNGVSLPVRMGLHTGTAEERDGNYFGRTLNRAARVMSAGHGGQILLSDVTAGLVRDDVDLCDLGEHRLAGVDAPMRLWQVGAGAFPPLRTSTHSVGNLPVPLDRFVGRLHEIGVLSELLKTQRLVTVVGVGGMGKTRLTVETLHRSPLDAADGVWFVDLVVAQSDRSVVDEVAALFRLQASPGRPVLERLVDHLEDKQAVLVFDNCEHVMGAAAALIDRLVHACPLLSVVATSREALMLRGEHVMALGPLPIDAAPNDRPGNRAGNGERDDARDGFDVDAVELFFERLIAEGGSADVTDHDRAVVGDICRQLDGMPLAIELAAARARTLGAAGVLARLGENLRLLSGGWRTGAGRQQTLAATLDWSYVLLDGHEQTVFDRLAVFVGWFSADDAVAVAEDSSLDPGDVIDALSGLVDKSMCTSDLGTTPARYRYLETMRAYGRDHLGKAGTLGECRDRHATHMAAVALRIRRAIVGPGELVASREAQQVTADMRAAFGWAVERRLDAVIDDIADFSSVMGSRGGSEFGSWFYDLRDDLADNPRVQANAAGHALFSNGDLAEVRRLSQRLLDLDNGAFAGVAWGNLGLAAFQDADFEHAIEYVLRGYELVEAAPDVLFDHIRNPVLPAFVLSATGQDPTEFIRQTHERANAANWPTGIAWAHCATGQSLLHTDATASLVALDRAIDVAAAVGSRSVETMARNYRMYLMSELLPTGELAAAYIDVLRRLQHSGDTMTAVLTLSNVIVLFDRVGRHDTAVVLCGWLDGRTGRNVQTVNEHHAAVASVRGAVGDRWDELFGQGHRMTHRQIIDVACNELATLR